MNARDTNVSLCFVAISQKNGKMVLNREDNADPAEPSLEDVKAFELHLSQLADLAATLISLQKDGRVDLSALAVPQRILMREALQEFLHDRREGQLTQNAELMIGNIPDFDSLDDQVLYDLITSINL